MKTQGAVITGGDFQGLGVIRSLGRKGIPVHVIDHELSIGRFSRHCKRFSFAPHPAQEDEYLLFLIDYAKKHKLNKWVLFANNDTVVRLLARHKERLEEYYTIPTPGWETIKHIYKGSIYNHKFSIFSPIFVCNQLTQILASSKCAVFIKLDTAVL